MSELFKKRPRKLLSATLTLKMTASQEKKFNLLDLLSSNLFNFSLRCSEFAADHRV